MRVCVRSERLECFVATYMSMPCTVRRYRTSKILCMLKKKSVTDLTMGRAVAFKSLEQNAYSSYDGVVVFLHSTVLVEQLSSSVRKECKA